MKRTILAAATALTVFGAVATPASAQTWNHNQNQDGRNDNDRDRNGRGDNDRRGDYDRRDNDRRGDNYRRDDNRGQWNNQGRYERQGYRNWRRGDRMSAYDMRRYRDVDYRRHYLRAPPRGYRYIQDDRGDTLLVGIATGVILSILLSQ